MAGARMSAAPESFDYRKQFRLTIKPLVCGPLIGPGIIALVLMSDTDRMEGYKRARYTG